MASSPLLKKIIACIEESGGISLFEYMNMALYDSEGGYYTKPAIIGQGGDYTTAPEISQLFGECVALWCVQEWFERGEGRNITLVELGPGKGTLMADMLRVFRRFKAFDQALETIYLVEKSMAFMAHQKSILDDDRIRWISDLDSLSTPNFNLVVANEFFDSLPIDLVDEAGRSHLIIADQNSQLYFRDSPNEIKTQRETYPLYPTILIRINSLLETGGSALIIDYGYQGAPPSSPTLQSLKNNRYQNPLSNPGENDITHLVNFDYLSSLIKPPLTTECQSQGDFLLAMGLEARLEQLCKIATPPEKQELITGAVRLTSTTHMGELFRVLTIKNQSHGIPS
jgi:NADH dehydrogenase [ubiquinone] 1 alpha subcomplex assembly factor 7